MNHLDRSMLAMNAVHGGLLSPRKPPDEHEKLVRNTQKWVAQTFYGAMLKEMRKSPFRNQEFEGGREGEAYEEMFDQRIADRMSQSAGSQLVNGIVSRIEAKRGNPSAKTVRDATTAYARAMQKKMPKAEFRAVPTKHGQVPWGRHDSAASRPPRGGAAHNPSSSSVPAPLRGHRRQQRILPELIHVAPTH